MTITFSMPANAPRVLLYWLIGVELMLTLCHLTINVALPGVGWGPVRPLLDLDSEMSVPTWFATVQLFAIAVVLLAAALGNRRSAEVPSGLLTAGALVFTILSADEGAMIHERFTFASRNHDLDWLLFGTGRGAWILPYLAAVTAGLLLLRRPLMRAARCHPRQAIAGAVGAAMIGVGAAGFELVSYYTVPDMEGPWYQAEVAAEELMEMAGGSLILCAALSLAGRLSAPVESPARADR